MTEQEKLALLEDALGVEEGFLKPEMQLTNLEEWDSISRLSFISLLDEKFGKTITGKEVKSIATVSEALELMCK